MNLVVFLAGLVIFLLLLADLFYTSFSLRGAGFISGPSTRAVWKVLVTFSSSRKKRLLNNAGLIIICQTLAQWILLLWISHFLMIVSNPMSFFNSQTNLPATLTEKIYVAGYAITTLGNGDFHGSTDWWRIFLSIAALNGLIVFTVSLTYLLQVLSKVNSKREFTRSISASGNNPFLFIKNCWDGKDFSQMDLLLLQWNQQVTSLTESHLSFPILHYYYSRHRHLSLAVMIAVLDESLGILHNRVPQQLQPNMILLSNTRSAIRTLLHTIQQQFLHAADTTPPTPNLDDLVEAGIPIIVGEVHEEQEAERKRLLLGFLQNEGRSWQDVYD